MMVTECAGYVARVQISSGSKKKLDKSELGLEKDFDKQKSWDSDSLDKFKKIYKPYVKILENGDKHTYPNRFIAGDGVVVVKQCRYEMRDIILVAESWLE